MAGISPLAASYRAAYAKIRKDREDFAHRLKNEERIMAEKRVMLAQSYLADRSVVCNPLIETSQTSKIEEREKISEVECGTVFLGDVCTQTPFSTSTVLTYGGTEYDERLTNPGTPCFDNTPSRTPPPPDLTLDAYNMTVEDIANTLQWTPTKDVTAHEQSVMNLRAIEVIRGDGDEMLEIDQISTMVAVDAPVSELNEVSEGSRDCSETEHTEDKVDVPLPLLAEATQIIEREAVILGDIEMGPSSLTSTQEFSSVSDEQEHIPESNFLRMRRELRAFAAEDRRSHETEIRHKIYTLSQEVIRRVEWQLISDQPSQPAVVTAVDQLVLSREIAACWTKLLPHDSISQSWIGWSLCLSRCWPENLVQLPEHQQWLKVLVSRGCLQGVELYAALSFLLCHAPKWTESLGKWLCEQWILGQRLGEQESQPVSDLLDMQHILWCYTLTDDIILPPAITALLLLNGGPRAVVGILLDRAVGLWQDSSREMMLRDLLEVCAPDGTPVIEALISCWMDAADECMEHMMGAKIAPCSCLSHCQGAVLNWQMELTAPDMDKSTEQRPWVDQLFLGSIAVQVKVKGPLEILQTTADCPYVLLSGLSRFLLALFRLTDPQSGMVGELGAWRDSKLLQKLVVAFAKPLDVLSREEEVQPYRDALLQFPPTYFMLMAQALTLPDANLMKPTRRFNQPCTVARAMVITTARQVVPVFFGHTIRADSMKWMILASAMLVDSHDVLQQHMLQKLVSICIQQIMDYWQTIGEENERNIAQQACSPGQLALLLEEAKIELQAAPCTVPFRGKSTYAQVVETPASEQPLEPSVTTQTNEEVYVHARSHFMADLSAHLTVPRAEREAMLTMLVDLFLHPRWEVPVEPNVTADLEGQRRSVCAVVFLQIAGAEQLLTSLRPEVLLTILGLTPWILSLLPSPAPSDTSSLSAQDQWLLHSCQKIVLMAWQSLGLRVQSDQAFRLALLSKDPSVVVTGVVTLRHARSLWPELSQTIVQTLAILYFVDSDGLFLTDAAPSATLIPSLQALLLSGEPILQLLGARCIHFLANRSFLSAQESNNGKTSPNANSLVSSSSEEEDPSSIHACLSQSDFQALIPPLTLLALHGGSLQESADKAGEVTFAPFWDLSLVAAVTSMSLLADFVATVHIRGWTVSAVTEPWLRDLWPLAGMLCHWFVGGWKEGHWLWVTSKLRALQLPQPYAQPYWRMFPAAFRFCLLQSVRAEMQTSSPLLVDLLPRLCDLYRSEAPQFAAVRPVLLPILLDGGFLCLGGAALENQGESTGLRELWQLALEGFMHGPASTMQACLRFIYAYVVLTAQGNDAATLYQWYLQVVFSRSHESMEGMGTLSKEEVTLLAIQPDQHWKGNCPCMADLKGSFLQRALSLLTHYRPTSPIRLSLLRLLLVVVGASNDFVMVRTIAAGLLSGHAFEPAVMSLLLACMTKTRELLVMPAEKLRHREAIIEWMEDYERAGKRENLSTGSRLPEGAELLLVREQLSKWRVHLERLL